jgi:hypothetical protein
MKLVNMPSRSGYTTIEIKKETRDRLVSLSKGMRDTYDVVINRIADSWEKKKR